MKNQIKDKLTELLLLMNDENQFVSEDEIKSKLHKILRILHHPEDVFVDQHNLKQKLETIVELVNNVMVDPEIDIEYCIPNVEVTSNSCDIDGVSYILVTYLVDDNNNPTSKIRLTNTYLNNSAEVIANLTTFYIEQFKSEINSVVMG